MTMKVLWSDTHHPFQHRKAVASLLSFIDREQPAEVCILGDFLDCKAPARWSKGRAEEYARDLEREVLAGRATLQVLRECYDGPVTYLTGNHEARIRSYAKQYAPALAGIIPDFPELLGFKEYQVQLMPQPYSIAPGVKAIHGELLSKHAGFSAQKEVERHGHSIVQGHSHRLGVVWSTTDRTRFALECGWLGDVNRADYLSFPGVANWQLGFGVLEIHGQYVQPTPVRVQADGSFQVGLARPVAVTAS